MPLNAEQVMNAALAVQPSSGGTADQLLIKEVIGGRRYVRCPGVTDGGTAATDVTERSFYTNNTSGNQKVVGITISCPVAVTTSDTTNKVFTFQKRPASAPQTPATVAVPDTSATGANSLGTTPLSVAFTKCTAPAASFTAANVILLPGDQLTFKTTHGSTGVAITAAANECDVEVILEPSS
jgi:hypothetical protein